MIDSNYFRARIFEIISEFEKWGGTDNVADLLNDLTQAIYNQNINDLEKVGQK